MVDLAERAWLSRYSNEDLGLLVHVNGALTDPDSQEVVVDMFDEATGTPIFEDRDATRIDVGTYGVAVAANDTAKPGFYRIAWRFVLNGTPETEETFVEIGQSAPAYDTLSDDFKTLVNNVWWRFADLFDSPMGGPHLQVYFQTQMGRGRIAQIMQAALGRLNIVSQPHMTFTLGPDGTIFPLADWGGLLEIATYIEVVKHLIRSYVEQPLAEGVTTARLDRRDYMNRWQEVLQMEQEDYKSMLDSFKIAFMGLSTSPRVLVFGGVYGTYGPTRLAGSAAARPRYWARFY